jgi:hypothetical protein
MGGRMNFQFWHQLFTSKSRMHARRPMKTITLEECEKTCDEEYDRDRRTCEWVWMMRGRHAADYQFCMSMARAEQVACFQECMKDTGDE